MSKRTSECAECNRSNGPHYTGQCEHAWEGKQRTLKWYRCALHNSMPVQQVSYPTGLCWSSIRANVALVAGSCNWEEVKP